MSIGWWDGMPFENERDAKNIDEESENVDKYPSILLQFWAENVSIQPMMLNEFMEIRY